MSTMKSCLLCFSGCNNELKANPPNLYKVCRKFLHSALVTHFEDENKSLAICTQCSESAKHLADLSEQLKFIQKHVSELAWMFSLEILHRRRKATENDGGCDEKVIEFNVSDLPNCDSWNVLTPLSENAIDQLLFPDCSLNENEIPEGITIEEIKCEPNLHVWTDVETCHSDNQSLDLVTIAEKSELNSPHFSTLGQDPILKIQKLQFQGDGKEIVVPAEIEYNRVKEEASKTVWTKADSQSSYRKMTEGASNENAKNDLHHTTQPFFSSKHATAPPEPLSSISNEVIRTKLIESPDRRRGKKSNSMKQRKHIKNIIDRAKNNTLTSKGFPCDVCGKIFSFKTNMIAHKKLVHSDKLPYECEFCKRRFKIKFSVIRHRMLHTGERPYICSLCPKSFIESCALKYHYEMKHSKETPFNCTICEKGFVKKSYFVRHLATHSGKKLYQCNLCDFKCYKSKRLQLHKATDHSNLHYNCKVCDEKFATPELVEGHYKSVHFDLPFTYDCFINTEYQP